MSDTSAMTDCLQEHLALSREMLQLAEEESRDLAGARPAEASTAFAYYQRRRDLLPRLNRSLDQLRRHRAWWQSLDPAEQQRHPAIAALIGQNQDLIMKAVCLDRENEKARLQQGLFGPRHLPPVQAQKPHFVAGLYRRHHRPQP